MRVIFMGTPEYAYTILKKLIDSDDIDVVALFTQADKLVGRGQILTPPIVKRLAMEHNILTYQPSTLRDENVIRDVLSIECDYIVVAAYGQILPKAILDHAPCINLHASILPLYRGASPIQQSLLRGDIKTGITAMLMEEGLDCGDIIKIEEIDILEDETQESLFNRLSILASTLTLEVLRNYKNYIPIKQDETKVTYCKKITKDDGRVSFGDAREIYNKYRAYSSWPGVFLDSGLKLNKIALNESKSKNRAGEILEISKEYIVVGCSSGSLKLYTLQPTSKNQMSAISYINGKRLKVGDILF